MEEISDAKSLKGAIFLEGKTGSPSRALWDPNDFLWHRNVEEEVDQPTCSWNMAPLR